MPPKKPAPKKQAKPAPAKAAAPKSRAPARARPATATTAAATTAAATATRPAKSPLPAPKHVVPAPAPVRRAPAMSEKDLAAFKVDLEAHREKYERELADLEAGFDSTQSDLSGEASFDEEYADAGTFTFERERDLSLGNNIRDLLERVNRALAKVADKSYGACERCGRSIEKARVKALPYATLCISCKQLEERLR